MHVSAFVDMIDSGFSDRVLLSDAGRGVSGAELAGLARRGASTLNGRCSSVVYVGENHPLLPVALLAAACAGVPFVPVNYRLDDDHLNALVARQDEALVLSDSASACRIDADGVLVFDQWVRQIPDEVDLQRSEGDENEVAVVLFTSGTTSDPKSVLLRHRHLMAYLLTTVDFGSAAEEEAALIAVPPYHIAGVANMLSNLFAGRRIVYLRRFDPSGWLSAVRTEGVTNAMVVPTMLARVVEALGDRPAEVPTLRTLSYGGAKVSERVLRKALALFPTTGFVNAYGLTETASTVAVLGPDDHRLALESEEPGVQRRLASVGRVLPAVEIDIRNEADESVPTGVAGMIYVRGDQIAGEYASGSVLDADGWFCTRDQGWVDSDGFLFIEGRVDDTIIRGGENIAPAEIEEVLLAHPDVVDACVVGVPDEEWGQRIVAAVVLREGAVVEPDDLREAVRSQLRGSKTPDQVVFCDSLPHTDTGKLLRRAVVDELAANS